IGFFPALDKAKACVSPFSFPTASLPVEFYVAPFPVPVRRERTDVSVHLGDDLLRRIHSQPGSVRQSNHRVLLRSRYTQISHNSGSPALSIESDLHAITLALASVVGNGRCWRAGWLLFIVNGCFEATNTFSESFSEFRKLFWSEDEQGNSDDN